jgi:acyl-CoA synthetase (AMP-forming)/AMP-acid ligase II
VSTLTPDILNKIHHARALDNAEIQPPAIPFRNIGELMRQQASLYEQKPFLIFYEDSGERSEFTYRRFFDDCIRTVNMLLACGVRRGDRIATVTHNHSDTVVQYFAAWMLGAVVVPINTGETDNRIQYILDNSETVLAFVREPYRARIEAMKSTLPRLRVIVHTGDNPKAGEPHFTRDLPSYSTELPKLEEVGLEDEVLIVYTSGTTGNPKGVVLVQQNLLADAQGIADWHALTPEQTMMCVLPIHHVNGTIVTIMTPMFFGGTLVLNQKFSPKTFFNRIQHEQVNVVSVVPTLLQFLLHEKTLTPAPTPPSTLRHIICGAGPLTVELAQAFEDHFKIRILHGYGLSETTCYSCFLPLGLAPSEHKSWMRDHGFPSIGVPIPQNEMEIHDAAGNSLPPDTRGEIVIRGTNVMRYYFNDVQVNEKTFEFGWFRSGDEGFYKVDSKGRRFFFITGRLKELIIRGGVNLSPFEIDEVLAAIPGIDKAMAVGFENDWYGEEVGAYVCLREGATLTEDEIINACAQKLQFHKVPKVVVFGAEFPVTSTGKYQRNKCKPLFAQYKSVQFPKRG